LAWVGRGITVVTAAALSLIAAPVYSASTVLFPKPLHLVRTIEDPLARGTTTVHEYCAGNQIITVNGSRVSIADYDKQQLTEIDRNAGTYSVTRFDDVAKANAGSSNRARRRTPATNSSTPGAVKAETWKSTPMGARAAAKSGRTVESWELVRSDAQEKTTIVVGIDRRMALSKDAVEALVGASYPNTRRDEHDALLKAASGPQAGKRQVSATSVESANAADYGLPVEEVYTFETQGARIEMRNSVVEVTEDLPPPELLIIPPGSQLVESHTARLMRELQDADALPAQAPRQ
jgi:hypothetical protein